MLSRVDIQLCSIATSHRGGYSGDFAHKPSVGFTSIPVKGTLKIVIKLNDGFWSVVDLPNMSALSQRNGRKDACNIGYAQPTCNVAIHHPSIFVRAPTRRFYKY